MLHARAWTSTLLCFAAAAMAQTTPPPAFEVASIKPTQEKAPPNSNFPLGPGDAYTPNGGHFSASNFPLFTYISFAYKLMPEQAQRFAAQMPSWAMTERFDIQARAQGTPGKNEMRLLMRALLAERCKLAVHEEEQQVPVAALMPSKPGKLGPQIQPHPAGTPCPKDAPPGRASEDQRFPLLCGGLLEMQPSAPGRLRFGARDVTLAFLAKSLSTGNSSGRPMIDATGLTGTFDFNLEWAADIKGPPGAGADTPSDPTGPTFEAALRDQLGLKLVSQKGSLTVLVLDHLERPSAN